MRIWLFLSFAYFSLEQIPTYLTSSLDPVDHPCRLRCHFVSSLLRSHLWTYTSSITQCPVAPPSFRNLSTLHDWPRTVLGLELRTHGPDLVCLLPQHTASAPALWIWHHRWVGYFIKHMGFSSWRSDSWRWESGLKSASPLAVSTRRSMIPSPFLFLAAKQGGPEQASGQDILALRLPFVSSTQIPFRRGTLESEHHPLFRKTCCWVSVHSGAKSMP